MRNPHHPGAWIGKRISKESRWGGKKTQTVWSDRTIYDLKALQNKSTIAENWKLQALWVGLGQLDWELSLKWGLLPYDPCMIPNLSFMLSCKVATNPLACAFCVYRGEHDEFLRVNQAARVLVKRLTWSDIPKPRITYAQTISGNGGVGMMMIYPHSWQKAPMTRICCQGTREFCLYRQIYVG